MKPVLDFQERMHYHPIGNLSFFIIIIIPVQKLTDGEQCNADLWLTKPRHLDLF